MSKDRELKEAVSQLAGTFGKDILYTLFCTVNSVNEDNRTCDCTPISGESDSIIANVQLQAEPNDGIFIKPSIGSTILVGISKVNAAFVLMFEDIDSVETVINNTVFKIEDGKITFNDGSFGGITKSESLTEKLNNLENAVNALISLYNSHTHNVTAVGVPTGISLNPDATILIPTIQAEIENTKIIHG